MGSFVTGLFQNIQEQTKALVFAFIFVFVLVDEQAISMCPMSVKSLGREKVRAYCERDKIVV